MTSKSGGVDAMEASPVRMVWRNTVATVTAMSSSEHIAPTKDVSLVALRHRLVHELQEVEALIFNVPVRPTATPSLTGSATSLTALAVGQERREQSLRHCLLAIVHKDELLDAFLCAPDHTTLELKARLRYRYLWSMIPHSDNVLCNVPFSECSSLPIVI